MDWMQFLAAVISSVAWPAAVVVILTMLRKPIGDLLPLIEKFKYKDIEVNLRKQLEAARDQVESVVADEPVADIPEPPTSFQNLAKADPRAAVLSAWLPVESELFNFASAVGYETSRKEPIHRVIRNLEQMGLLDRTVAGSLDKLRIVRNDAVHLSERQVSYEEAMNMAELCEWTRSQLQRLQMIYKSKGLAPLDN
ncbi:hypothetical protein ACM74J_14690 [Pseudomonas aeruginosa]|uniref:hypothetical protein n=1 Tax=Pseudomonas aeruginosa TaxID=287 RepID=UPI00290382C4|nr:hypothetical protein [Pseudomonas aeruginosa]MDU0742736.1 hypothetical protein [Pseudomonas aeruginosa]MDU0753323.1 hypothetical protein [Pseudomonas aeruginosa]